MSRQLRIRSSEAPPHARKRNLPLTHRQDGQDVVETVIILPLFLLLLIGIIEFAFIIFTYGSVALLAREGARCGVIAYADEATARTAVESCITSRAIGPLYRCGGTTGGLTVNVDFAPDDVGAQDPPVVDVEVICQWPLLSGFVGPTIDSSGTVDLSSIARMRRE